MFGGTENWLVEEGDFTMRGNWLGRGGRGWEKRNVPTWEGRVEELARRELSMKGRGKFLLWG